MKRMLFHGLFAGLAVWLTAVPSQAVPNPAAAYAEKMGYLYTANEAGGTVAMPDGVVLDAWAFFRGKVGSEYAYGALYGYDTINRRVETNGYVESFAVCVPKDSLKKSTPAEIPLLDLMRQNGEPLWENTRGAPPPAVEAIMKTAPLKTFPKQALPSSFDWRNVGGLSYIGGVRDQGSCGSCYSFGAAAAAEGAFNVALGKTGSSCADFSEAYIAWCLGKYGAYSSHFGGCDGADYDYQELEALTVEGICNETQMPYKGGADPKSCTYSGTTTVFEAWYRVPSGDINAIKTAIMTYGVVDAAVLTDTAFMNYDTGVYANNNKTCDQGYNETSDHAISLVGWDDNPPEGGGGVFILRNSWGTSGTGEGGYMRIRTNAAVVHCAVCYMVYGAPLESAPTFTSGTNYSATTGVTRTFTVTASGNPTPVLALQSTTASAGYYTFTTNTGVLSYQPPTNDVGTKTFTFRATNTQGAATQTVGVTVSLAPPAAPASIWASATNTTDFTAAWSSVAGATGYRLDVATNSSFGGGGGVNGTLLSEGFDNGISAPDGWAFTAIGGTYTSAGNFGATSPSLKLDASGDAVQTPPLSGPTNVSFWIKGQTSTGSSLLLEAASGGSWSAITNITTLLNTATTYSCPLGTSVTNLRFTYTKVSSNLAFDDVLVTGGSSAPSYVAGYSNRTVAGTSQSVTGLTAGVTYYFRARATNGAGTSGNSSVANVKTLTTLSSPVFGANPGPVATTAGVVKVFTVSASGVPAPTLALTAQTATSGYGFVPATGVLTYTPPQADAGSKTFTFSASNSQGVAYQTVTAAVTAATMPVFTGGAGPYSTTVGVAVAFTVSASGTPAATLALQSQTASSGFSFNPATGAFTYTPPVGDVGAPTFIFAAGNAAGMVAQTTTVNVAAVPTAPAAPASIWASATNAIGFTAAWSTASGATSYRLDVGTNATFTSGGGAGGPATNCYQNGTLGAGTGGTWTETGLTQASGYLLSLAGDILITPVMDFTASTSETLTFNARTYGGVNAANNVITVSISTNNGSSWASLGTRTPLSATLTAMTPFDLSSFNQSQVFVKLETLGASAGIGAGIDEVLITNMTSSSSASYVPGYSNRTVSGVSQAVTGLVANSTYYFRARAVNGAGTSADSATASVKTSSNAPVGTPPTVNAIPVQSATVGVLFDYTLTATATDGDPILSFACTSAVDAGIWDVDNDGYFLFGPTAAQLGTNVFSFTATDKDGTSAPVQMSIKVYSAAATNDFAMWVEDQGEDPETPEFAPEEDADGDGRSNFEEYMADTDPGDSNMVFEVTGDYANGTLNVGFPASPNRYYQLEYKTNLISGGNVVSNLGWGGSGTLATNIPPEWYGTIRVRLTAP